MSRNYSIFDAVQVFKEKSFLGDLDQFEFNLEIYPKTDNFEEEGLFYIYIVEQPSPVYEVDAAKKEITILPENTDFEKFASKENLEKFTYRAFKAKRKRMV